VAKKLNGRKQPGSGSSMYAKGDVKQSSGPGHSLDRFLIECKQTKHASMSVKGEWLSKISREAMAVGLEPALSVEIKGHSDRQLEEHWVMIPMSVFQRLFNAD
jgi:Holliday junction resolvase